MDSRIIVTGATGNLGVALLERLRSEWPDREIVALTRSTNSPVFTQWNVRPVKSDLSDPSTYRSALTEGCVVIAVAHRAFTDQMLPSINEVGAEACFAVTSTSAFVRSHPEYRQNQEIEERMRASRVPVAILRPSMLYGRGRDQNISRLVRVLAKSPLYPVFGSGNHLMQPVYVDDVAGAIVTAVSRQSIGEYNLAGPAPMTYNELLRMTADAMGRHTRFVHIPQRLAEVAVSGLQHIPRFPVDVHQVRRLTEDKTYDISAAVRDLDYAPRSFHDGIRDQLASMPDVVVSQGPKG